MNSAESIFHISQADTSFSKSEEFFEDPTSSIESNSKENLSFEVENSDTSFEDESYADDNRFPSLNLLYRSTSPSIDHGHLAEYSIHSGKSPLSLRFKRINIQSPILEFKHSSITFPKKKTICSPVFDISDLSRSVSCKFQDGDSNQILSLPNVPEQKLFNGNGNNVQLKDQERDIGCTPKSANSFQGNIRNNTPVTLPIDLVILPHSSLDKKETAFSNLEHDAKLLNTEMQDDLLLVNKSTLLENKTAASFMTYGVLPEKTQLTENTEALHDSRIEENGDSSRILTVPIHYKMANKCDITNINGSIEGLESSSDKSEKLCQLKTADDCISSIKSLIFPGFIAQCPDIESTEERVKREVIKSTASLLDILTGDVKKENPLQSVLSEPIQNQITDDMNADSETTDDVCCSESKYVDPEQVNDTFVCLDDHKIIPEHFDSTDHKTKNCLVAKKIETPSDPELPTNCEALPHHVCDTLEVPKKINANSIQYIHSEDQLTGVQNKLSDKCEQDIKVQEDIFLEEDTQDVQYTKGKELQNLCCGTYKENVRVEEVLDNINIEEGMQDVNTDEVIALNENSNTTQSTTEDVIHSTFYSSHLPLQNLLLHSQEEVAHTQTNVVPNMERHDTLATSGIIDISSFQGQTRGDPSKMFNPLKIENNILNQDIAVYDFRTNANANIVESRVTSSDSDALPKVYSPLLFSDDEESESNSRITSCSQTGYGIEQIQNGGTVTEQRRLKQIQESLIGVYPPPSVTIPRIGVIDMLISLKENVEFLQLKIESENQENSIGLKQAMECEWPAAKLLSYPGIHYNNGLTSEKFESLSLRFSQRYVGCETASSCTVWSSMSSNTSSNMRNKRLGGAHSPGSRLSHLARRRKAFSKDNLIVNNNVPKSQANTVAERRQIVVNKRNDNKLDLQCQNGRVPALSARPMTHKRALFQSPESAKKKKTSAKKSNSAAKRMTQTIKTAAQSFKRALFASGTTNVDLPSSSRQTTQSEADSRKRSRDDSHAVPCSSKRKLLFGNSDASSSGSSEARVASATSAQDRAHPNGTTARLKERLEDSKKRLSAPASSTSNILSSAHKKKLLWAVAEALRGKGINIRHTSFKLYASTLARTCRHLLPTVMKSANGSTSEIMLQLANQQIENVIRDNPVKEGDS